jgi:hypothetical protein
MYDQTTNKLVQIAVEMALNVIDQGSFSPTTINYHTMRVIHLLQPVWLHREWYQLEISQ